MTVNISFSPEMESRLREQAAERGLKVSDYVLHVLERELPPRSPSARRLLALPPQERGLFLAAAAEDAAALYEADLTRPPAERELTALTALDGSNRPRLQQWAGKAIRR